MKHSIILLCVLALALASCRTTTITLEKREGDDYVKVTIEGPPKEWIGGISTKYGTFELEAGETHTSSDPGVEIMKVLLAPDGLISRTMCVANPAFCTTSALHNPPQ